MTDEAFPEWRLERIATAVETVEESIAILSEKQQLSFEQFESDSEARDVVERRFVKTTEATLDIGRTILAYERETVSETYPAIMRKLGELGVLPQTTSEEMVEAARFRNVLAHTYGEDIDHVLVYEALQDLERYRDFLHAVRAYLGSVTQQ